ncbi:hypothetical protein HYT05_03360 [Candidatus Kaiserbacteria bacterium]|nr:hypothetical protein [Candidatus Kaiserbacteria bacterium]
MTTIVLGGHAGAAKAAYRPWIWYMLAIVVVLGVTFQIAHFLEHGIQAGVWFWGSRSAPWMSAAAMWLSHSFGQWFFHMTGEVVPMERQMMMGMELLHLVGNSIFLVTIASLYYFVPTKWVRWAFYVEGFHLYEHIMLTSTCYFIGKPIGLSTLFGGTAFLFQKEGLVGFRVMWHFLMNLVPTSLMMMGMTGWLKGKAR